MRRNLQLLRNLAGAVWEEKWEAVIGLLALVGTMPTVSLPLAGLYGLLAVFLFYSLARYILKTGRELREKHLPLMVVAGRTDDELAQMADQVWATMARWGFNPRDYDVRYDVERDDLTTRREHDLPVEGRAWAELAHKFETQLIRLSRQLKGHKVFHVFLNCPSALAIGMGAIAGTRFDLVVHHYFQRQDRPYVDVLNFHQHNLKTGVGAQIVKSGVPQPFKFIEVTAPATPGPQLYVCLQLASSSHDPLGPVMRQAQQDGAVVASIRNTYNNVLNPRDDWLGVAREVVSALSTWLADPQVESIHLFLNSPLPLAFAIGMALGTQSPVIVHHWFAKLSGYKPVLQLNQLRQRR